MKYIKHIPAILRNFFPVIFGEIKNQRHIRVKISVISAVLLISIASFLVWKRIQYNKQNPYGVWETMVVLRDQTSGGTEEEDRKSSLKRGDVISVREEKHSWSETEYKSYLLVKIEGRKNEVEKLLLPKTADKTADRDADNTLNDTPTEEIVRARRYVIDMGKIDFTGNQVVSGQPVEDRIFKVDIIREK